MHQSQGATAPVVFQFAQSHQIRVILIDDAPWFVAADVCAVLNIQNSRDAVTKLDDDEKADVALTDTSSNGTAQRRSFTLISEPGLYTLILRCRDAVKPGTVAYRFRKWVTAEVLPAIRKTGRYEVAPAQDITPVPVDPSLVNAIHVARIVRELAHTAKFLKHTPAPQAKLEKFLLATFGLACLHLLPVERVEQVSQWLHQLRLQICEHDVCLETLEARFLAQTLVPQLEAM